MIIDENTLIIYTDGSFYPHDRWRGGVGITFVYNAEDGTERTYDLPKSGYKGASIIEMEIKACTLALKEAKENPIFSNYRNVVIYSDSQFIVDYHRKAETMWPRNKWLRSGGAPVSNVPEWEELNKAKRKLGKLVEILKVKAHSTNVHNKRADKLAKQSARIPINKSQHVVRVGKKYSSSFTDRGSVRMLGQVMSIHIISCEYLHKHKTNKYRYEVINRESKYFEMLDLIYSELSMRRHHCYEVRVNNDHSYPQVVEIIKEIEPSADILVAVEPNL